MAARTFEDSRGAAWEVFEVRRASSNPNGVSAGLEAGWLTFVHGADRRRLAPFPHDWEQAPAGELERMCELARAAVSRDNLAPHAPPAETDAPVRVVEEEALAAPVLPEVEEAVRVFAHEARAAGLPAIAAMVRLKAMLLERFPGPEHAARDMTHVRRWFVDAYYFKRDA